MREQEVLARLGTSPTTMKEALNEGFRAAMAVAAGLSAGATVVAALVVRGAKRATKNNQVDSFPPQSSSYSLETQEKSLN
jgi:hypothetical protein